ncbi:MAG: ATP-binding protein [Myxococcota bacterium]
MTVEAAGGGPEFRWDTPELGVRAVKVLLLYFSRTYGRERLEQVWRDARLPLPLSHVEDLNNYISVAFLELLMKTLLEGSGDPQFLDKAGRAIASPEALGFAYYMLRGVGTPELVYQKTVELAPTYNRVGTFQIESQGKTHLTLRYSSTVREKDHNLCTMRKASYAAFPGIWGLPDATVKETQCLVDGADCCRYELSWRARPPLVWRRWVFGLLGTGLGVATAAWGVAPPPLLGVALGALGFFLGGWLDLRRVTEEKDQRLGEQTAGLTRSVEELQRRGEEIHRANVELDKRVADRTRELEDALERLKRLDTMKSEFFANVSHELRTPLTLILAPLDDRLPHAASPAERELMLSIRRNADRLLRLVDDLLDLSRIEAGQLRLDIVAVDLAALTRQVLATFQRAADARRISLSASVPPSTRDVWGDRHRLESILGNLLGNALKYTPTGGRITVALTESDTQVAIRVTDTGPGISAEDLPHLFQRFYQGTSEGVRRRGGMGIGLALAQNLAELHGGRIEVQSELQKGSVFTVILPKGRAHFRPEVLERRRVQIDVKEGRRAADAYSTPSTPVPGDSDEAPSMPETRPITFEGGRRPRVLIVEDNDEMRELLRGLVAASCDVLLAVDGAEGLAIAKAQLPDLVLSDVMMPAMPGTALVHALKQDPALRSTPVLLLTARSGPESALEGFGAGADDFIEKPFHPRVLLARIAAHLQLRALSLQLASQARLAAIGTLAAGVGHEVRNPVNAVLNGVRVLLGRQDIAANDQRLLKVVEEGAGRIERISAALLHHASPGDRGGWRPVDLCGGLEATLSLMQHELTKVEVHRDYQAQPRVVAPAAELNQVFLNLIDNARKAGAHNVWLRVSTAGGRARVAVEDDGPGVPPEIAARLFVPFATSRAPGEGTGLGLFIASESVKRFGGTLSHAPRPGGGAAFTVDLPLEKP